MRKLIANEFMTLDGVVQVPGYADEDMTGGFAHGGWHARYLDDRSMSWVVENLSGAGGCLLGRGAGCPDCGQSYSTDSGTRQR